MARFEDAIPIIMAHEGGWASDGLDGGGTNFGITYDTFKTVRGASATLEDLRELSADGAAEIYRHAYWLPVYDLIDDQQVGTKTFDMAVNMGHRQSHVLVQRACGDCGYRLIEDGRIGPASLAAINSCQPHPLLLAIVHNQVDFYRTLAAQDPKFQPFLSGWLTRAAWMGSEQKGVA
jgi:lysozyme family protein